MRKTALTLVLAILTANLAWGQGVRWEIEPKKDPRAPIGKLTVFGGQTGPEGVRLLLKDLNINSPIQMIVSADDANKPLKVIAYKEDPQKALLERSTDRNGMAVLKFRTGDEVQFRISGPEGSSYETAVWVGPPIELNKPLALESMKNFKEGVSRQASAVTATSKSSAADQTQPAAPAGTESKGGSTNTILLALIFVALAVIAFLLYRGQKRKSVNIILFALLIPAIPLSANDFKPDLIPPGKERQRMSQALHQLHDRLGQIDASGIQGANDLVQSTQLLIAFMEEFGLIDPREAAVQPNFNPPGLPPLPSRAADDPRVADNECYHKATATLEAARKMLENNYVVLKQTELKAGRIVELANAAAGLSPYAQLAWSVSKANPNEPMNKSKEKFYSTYDAGQGNGLKALNEALIALGECEKENFGDENWYNRYGLPYYMFMRDRYTRRP